MTLSVRERLIITTTLAAVFADRLPAGEVPGGAVTVVVPPGFTLAWSDEFDGDKLDVSKWNYRTGIRTGTDKRADLGTANRAENVSVSGGMLRIALRKESFPGADHSGGGVISKPVFRHGFYLARCRMPVAKKGWHSSFWLMNHNPGVKTVQELDIVENDTSNLRAYGVNVHNWLGEHRSWGHLVVKTPDLSADFHHYGADVSDQRVVYYFDGKPVQTVDLTSISLIDHSIWLTSLVTPWGKAPVVDDSTTPCEFLVDWVRYYRRTTP